MSITVTAPFNPETGETYTPSASPEDVVRLLRSALALFGEEGQHWSQGAIYCSYVAVLMTVRRPGHALNAALAGLLDTLDEPVEWAWCFGQEIPEIDAKALIVWNDAEGRTFAEVKDLFESTIGRLEG